MIRRIPLLLVLMSGAASAQATREGNIWNGVNHEPSAPTVGQDERAGGIAPSEQQQKREDQTLENLDRTLQHEAAPPR